MLYRRDSNDESNVGAGGHSSPIRLLESITYTSVVSQILKWRLDDPRIPVISFEVSKNQSLHRASQENPTYRLGFTQRPSRERSAMLL